jgi:hypothetical protein
MAFARQYRLAFRLHSEHAPPRWSVRRSSAIGVATSAGSHGVRLGGTHVRMSIRSELDFRPSEFWRIVGNCDRSQQIILRYPLDRLLKEFPMIHFRCPVCRHTLKVSRKQAGSASECPRCGETVPVPAYDAGESVAIPRPAAAQFTGLFLEPSQWRWLAIGVAIVAILSLLLAVLASVLHSSGSVAGTAREVAMVATPLCLLILFLLLYGRGTSCPTCGRWWARIEGATESLGREEFEKGDTLWVRARRRISYSCQHCRHAWWEAYSDEYPGAAHD